MQSAKHKARSSERPASYTRPMPVQAFKFGVIGGGLMGKEFASAAARWFHLEGVPAKPIITAICDPAPAAREWFQQNVPTVTLATDDLATLLNSDIDAVYVAVPHHLHLPIYRQVIEAGKHLFAEKPFGIDLESAEEITEISAAHPDVKIGISSEFPFYPAVQRIIHHVEAGEFGEIFEVRAAFNHCSDLDPNKPINWKRQIAFNGEYGCMGDLGLHVCHVPFRLGFHPANVRAALSNIVKTRPGPDGKHVPCETWDNATLLCQTEAGATMLLETKRISPGDTNSWKLEIYGTKMSAQFSTAQPKTLRTLRYQSGQPQEWREESLGQPHAFKSITGHIFEFGFSDAILQMWAAYLTELAGETPPFPVATPAEALLSHRLFTAALKSQAHGTTEPV